MKSTVLVGALALLLFACSSAPSEVPAGGNERAGSVPEGARTDSAGAPAAPAPGPFASTLRVHLVDAPTDEVSSIVVTIAKIEASIDGQWLGVTAQEHTVDLLTLQHGAFLDLGAASLPPGRVEQVRLRLAVGGDHHVVTLDGEEHPLIVPSGEQSGIKLVGGFDLAPCSTAQLTIDFDGKRSLHQRGRPGSREAAWMLQPVVRMQALVSTATCEAGTLEDTCAAVTCAETELCENGTCRATQ